MLDGGIDDDILDGGAGDDIIQGGAGTDVLVGGADHDIVLGDDFAVGDDNAVDYLYGDFGTNLNEPGSGGDRLFGQGGNDLEFGEGADDAIIDPLGASNLIDAGAGDDPAVFVAPPPTPNPVPAVTPDDPLAVNTLPSGPTYAGWWAEIAGSATGFGLSGGVGAALDTTVACDASGVRYVAWSDTRNGNYEIYVARESASGWEMLGGSAAGGGVSDSQTDSRRPALLDPRRPPDGRVDGGERERHRHPGRAVRRRPPTRGSRSAPRSRPAASATPRAPIRRRSWRQTAAFS